MPRPGKEPEIDIGRPRKLGLTNRELEQLDTHLHRFGRELVFDTHTGRVNSVGFVSENPANQPRAFPDRITGNAARELAEMLERETGTRVLFDEKGVATGLEYIIDGGGVVEELADAEAVEAGTEILNIFIGPGQAAAEGEAGALVSGEGIVAIEAGTEAIEGVVGIEAGEITGALAAESAMAGVLGTTAVVGGVVVVAAAIVLGALCIFHVFSACKKKVCRDPRGRWHSHESHCHGGCLDKNGLWHRHEKRCHNQVCHGPDGTWHHNEKHCDHFGCIDPNGEWHRHEKHCHGFKCTDDVGRAHKHQKHCGSKGHKLAERDTAFARPDLLSVDNSYIVITNAANFQPTELDVLKEMVIMPDDNPEVPTAHFESGDAFSEEGTLTQVEHGTAVWTGNFSFPYPGTEKPVEGKWLAVDSTSEDAAAKRLLWEIQAVHAKAAALRQ